MTQPSQTPLHFRTISPWEMPVEPASFTSRALSTTTILT
jgi:hypothetical protein